jgi:peptidoglycan/LPS O-acetylase OafA/YrhL
LHVIPSTVTLQSVATALTEHLDAPRSQPETARFYVPELDSLRFFAFFGVFVCHIVHEMGYGDVISNIGGFGVDLFFTLSAYLITELLMREKERFGRLDVRAFYARRILRIWPLYFGFLAACFAASRLFPVLQIGWKFFACFAVFLGNFALALIGLTPGLTMVPLWSVCVEEQFYITWPLIARHLSRRGVAISGASIWVLSICCRWLVIREGLSVHLIEIGTLCRLDPIACGMLLSSFLGGSTEPKLKISRRKLVLIGADLWAFAGLCLYHSSTPTPLDFIVGFPAVAIGCGAFTLAAIGAGSWMFNRRLIYLGRISYGLYVYHGAAILMTLALFAPVPGWLKWLICPLLSLGLTIAVSAISYRWFETPFLRLKTRYQYIRSASAAVA